MDFDINHLVMINMMILTVTINVGLFIYLDKRTFTGIKC